MNHLYWIIDKAGNKELFKLNWAQEKLYYEMWYCNLILKARQLGISTFVGLLFLDRCLFNSNQHAGIIAHTREDAEMLFRSKSYSYGKHIVPHDAAVHEYSTGLSRVEVARNHGIVFTIAHDIILIEGIDAVRNILSRCWFDEVKCMNGIKALENYKKEWNDRHGCWSSKPLHDFASHGADAFRMLAVSLNKLTNRGFTANEWRSLREQYVL